MNKIFYFIFIFLNFNLFAEESTFTKAEEYFKKGKLEMALVFYNKTLEREPDNIQALFNRGRIHLYNKDYVSAISDLKKVLDISLKRTDVYYYLGCSYAGKGDAESAIDAFLKVPSNDKNYVSVFLNLGNIYLGMLKDKEKTIENWEKFLNLKPSDEQAEKIREAIKCLKDPQCWESVLAELNNNSLSSTNSSSTNVSSDTNKIILPDFIMPDIKGEGTKADVSKQKNIEDKKSIRTE